MTAATFFVPGIPAPGGSKRAFLHRVTGKIIVKDDCKRNKDWRTTVKAFAVDHFLQPFRGPVKVTVIFQMPRPKGHFGSGKNAGKVKDSAPPFPITKPDATKLWRAAEDSLKGIAWLDDSQVVRQTVVKIYSDTPGAQIMIEPMDAVSLGGNPPCSR